VPAQRISVTDGRSLTVYEDGDPDGRPVVYHHGTPGSHVLYAGWLTPGVRLIGYDRAGYGGSDRDAGRDVAAVAGDVAALADALGVERFATWGVSGGGPHALATAALLGDRVVAAATLAGVAPADAPELDFMAGMGEDNVQEFEAAFAGEDRLRPLIEAMAAGMLGANPEQLVEAIRSVVSPPDVAALRGELGDWLVQSVRQGIRDRVDGWVDDDLAFVKPWGFDPASITVPLQIWQGEQDLMVPPAHGRWLAARLPDADPRISADDGHLTLAEAMVANVHAWLLTHF
jgi:pimeloyl-ACP methyl ester carboxylesterase